MVTVVLAENSEMYRSDLRAVIEVEHDFQIVGEAEDGWEAWDKAESLDPDILVVNSSIPGLHSRAIAERTLELPLRTRMVVIRRYDGSSYVCESIDGGVMGFVINTTGNEELVRNIREILQGRFVPQFASFWSYSA